MTRARRTKRKVVIREPSPSSEEEELSPDVVEDSEDEDEQLEEGQDRMEVDSDLSSTSGPSSLDDSDIMKAL